MLINEPIGVFLQDIGLAAYSLGHEIFIVGGYVRNKLYREFNSIPNQEIFDIDLVINTDAIEFIHKYQIYLEDNDREHLTFEIVNEYPSFGTIKIHHPRYPNYQIEIASTRIESYENSRVFPKVEIVDDIKLDLPRRDFTINALLISLMPDKFVKHSYGDVLDYVGALDDIKNGLIRAFHPDSFSDDSTRILRAVRFKFEYDFEIEAKTLSWIFNTVKLSSYLDSMAAPQGRFKLEMAKILALPKAKEARSYLDSLLR